MTAEIGPQLGPVLERISKSAQAVEAMSIEMKNTSASATQTVDTVGADVNVLVPKLSRNLADF